MKTDWDIEVERNKNNLCVWCGEPMVTTIYHDVPVCKEHLDREDGEQ